MQSLESPQWGDSRHSNAGIIFGQDMERFAIFLPNISLKLDK